MHVVATVDHGDGSSGLIKSKSESCPLVLKNWPSDKSDKQDGLPQSSGVGKN